MIIVTVTLFSILMNLGKIVLQVENYPANIQYIYSSFLCQSLNKNIYVRKQNDDSLVGLLF